MTKGNECTGEEEIEFDFAKFADFYFKLPSGQDGRRGARIDQIETPLIKTLGEPSSDDGRARERAYWVASEETIRNWRKAFPKRPVLKKRKVLEALMQEFGEDFSASLLFTNYFAVFDEVRSFLEASRVQLEPLGPMAARTHQLRIGALTFEQSVMPLRHRGQPVGEVMVGFRSAQIAIQSMSNSGFAADEPKIVLEHLSWRVPESQIGKVMNATVQIDLHRENEWKVLMVPGDELMNAALSNTIFIEANLDHGEQVSVNVLVGKDDFGPYESLPKDRSETENEKIERAKKELMVQILRQRIDENDRYSMAYGVLTAE